MAINFAAESMQGYNNPKIEIINAQLDKHGALITQITFDNITKILARGVFPFLSLWSVIQGKRTRYIMPLASARDDEILFSTIVMDGSPNSPSGTAFGFKFVKSGTPLLLRMPIQGTIS